MDITLVSNGPHEVGKRWFMNIDAYSGGVKIEHMACVWGNTKEEATSVSVRTASCLYEIISKRRKAPVAQRSEHAPDKGGVGGSSPSGSTSTPGSGEAARDGEVPAETPEPGSEKGQGGRQLGDNPGACGATERSDIGTEKDRTSEAFTQRSDRAQAAGSSGTSDRPPLAPRSTEAVEKREVFDCREHGHDVEVAADVEEGYMICVEVDGDDGCGRHAHLCEDVSHVRTDSRPARSMATRDEVIDECARVCKDGALLAWNSSGQMPPDSDERKEKRHYAAALWQAEQIIRALKSRPTARHRGRGRSRRENRYEVPSDDEGSRRHLRVQPGRAQARRGRDPWAVREGARGRHGGSPGDAQHVHGALVRVRRLLRRRGRYGRGDGNGR